MTQLITSIDHHYKSGRKTYEGQFNVFQIKEGKGTEFYNKEFSPIKYEGQFQNGKYNGFGILYYSSGGKLLEAYWKDGQAHGYGTQYNENGNIKYQGKYCQGKFFAKGTLYHQNGQKFFEGNFKEGESDGYGISYSSDEKIEYEGYWSNGMKHGYGTFNDSDGQKHYEGNFVNDLKNGYGKQYYCDGSTRIYEGNFLKNDWDGYGSRYDINGGLVVEGHWKRNLIEKIELTENSQNKNFYVKFYPYDEVYYIGELTSDFPKNRPSIENGKGQLISKKFGSILYSGAFVDGNKQGFGTSFHKTNGSVLYIGQFHENQRKGRGTLYYENGRICSKGFWLEGYYTNNYYEFYNEDGSIIR